MNLGPAILFRQGLILIVLAFAMPSVAKGTFEQDLNDKRAKVVMRMIGHEVLTSLGDCDSRVLPIEKTDGPYRISFETEFGFNPDDLFMPINQVIVETGITNNYLVEVEQCKTKAIVHSFVIENAAHPYWLPCGGRIQPKDCYNLLITLADKPAKTNPSTLTSANRDKVTPLKLAYLIVPLFILVGFLGYIKQKQPTNAVQNAHLVLIGGTQLDVRNRRLTFADKSVELSHKETELLTLLHRAVNQPLKREAILKEVWGDEGDYVGRTLDVFVSKLRKKLAADSKVKIENVRGIGYQLIVLET